MPTPADLRHIRLEQTDAGFMAQVVDCRLLDEQSTPPIEGELFELVDQLGAAQLLLNLSGTDFMSSIGLGMLIGLHRRLKDSGGHLAVVGVSDEIYELIEVTGLTNLLDVRRTRQSRS
jgi:anti-sigma B factor antagonist